MDSEQLSLLPSAAGRNQTCRAIELTEIEQVLTQEIELKALMRPMTG